jgi:hypothetical protein
MSTITKKIEALEIDDFKTFPIWTLINDDAIGEISVTPVKKYPVKSTEGKIFGLEVYLANGRRLWAMIDNVDSVNSRSNEHFLSVSLSVDDKWISLARYHDIDYDQNGPQSLASLLNMPIDEVFPISYDLTLLAVGEKAALKGSILKEPEEKLSDAELIALAIP